MTAAAETKRWRTGSRLQSLGHACDGLRWLLRHEANARIHLGMAAAVAVGGLLLRVSAGDWCWLLLAIAMVLSAEAMNTALECVCDAVSPQWNAGIGRAKDVAAAAVLINALAAAGIGACVLLPYLVRWAT